MPCRTLFGDCPSCTEVPYTVHARAALCAEPTALEGGESAVGCVALTLRGSTLGTVHTEAAETRELQH